MPDPKISFRPREFKGSRLRCLQLTSQSPDRVRAFLQGLISPFGDLNESSSWLPGGFLAPREVNLNSRSAEAFLTPEQREALAGWWLQNRQGATTPTWDIVAKCQVEGKDSLLLVEAKAHGGELGSEDACAAQNEGNRQRIGEAISEANAGLNAILPGWSLQRDSHYQLSNRFALSWKLASMGVPVILVYLGFLDAWDMDNGARNLLRSADHWRDCLRHYAKDVVPPKAWGERIMDTPLIPLIRAARVEVSTECCLALP